MHKGVLVQTYLHIAVQLSFTAVRGPLTHCADGDLDMTSSAKGHMVGSKAMLLKRGVLFRGCNQGQNVYPAVAGCQSVTFPSHRLQKTLAR